MEWAFRVIAERTIIWELNRFPNIFHQYYNISIFGDYNISTANSKMTNERRESLHWCDISPSTTIIYSPQALIWLRWYDNMTKMMKMMMTNMTTYSMFGCLVDGSSHQATALHLTTLNIPPTLMEHHDAFLMMMRIMMICIIYDGGLSVCHKSDPSNDLNHIMTTVHLFPKSP